MAAAHSSLVRYFHQSLPTTYEPVGKIGSGPSDASQVVPAADDRHWRPNLDSLEKQRGEISRIPHASVGRGISWKVTGVHPNRWSEFHEVRHRGPDRRPSAANPLKTYEEWLSDEPTETQQKILGPARYKQ